MIPNEIKQLLVWIFRILTLPFWPFKRPARAARPRFARICIGYGSLMSDPQTQGDFNLPREFRRPFFLAAYLATLAVAAYYGLYWVENIADPKMSAFTIAKAGVTMAPGFFAVVLFAGLLFSPPIYAINWGVGMLGAFLRRMDQSETIEDLRERNAKLEETQTEVEKLRERNTELEEAQAQFEADKETLRNQVRRTGQEPEA